MVECEQLPQIFHRYPMNETKNGKCWSVIGWDALTMAFNYIIWKARELWPRESTRQIKLWTNKFAIKALIASRLEFLALEFFCQIMAFNF